MDKPATGAMCIPSQWISTIPQFPRQQTADQPLGHPPPQGQAILPNQDIPPNQVIGRSRASNTRISARGVSKAKKTFKCKECGRVCKDAWTLQDHMPKHSDEQRFVCNDCGGRFKRSKDLKSHTKNTCPSTSQADAALTCHQTRNTRSEPGATQFVIVTPESYERRSHNRGEADLEPESGDAVVIPIEPLLFSESFLSNPRYEGSYTLTMSELDGVEQGSSVDPDVMKVLYDPEFTRTYHELSKREPINHQLEDTHTPHNNIIGTISTGPNSRHNTGSGFQFTTTPSSTGSPNVPLLDDGTESESPPPSSLNTNIPKYFRRLSLRNSKSVQGFQAYDQYLSGDFLSPPLNPFHSPISQGHDESWNEILQGVEKDESGF